MFLKMAPHEASLARRDDSDRRVNGASDERVPVSGARQLAADLKKAGAPIEYIEYPDTRHGPTAEKAYADPNLMAWLLGQRRH
jgi:hypothetical protein